MNAKELNLKFEKIQKSIIDKKLSEAFEELQKTAALSSKTEFKNTSEKLKETYLMMLKYSFSGIEDPHQEKVYSDIRKKLLKLSDTLEQEIILEKSLNKIAIEKKIFKKQIFREKIELGKLLHELSEQKKQHKNQDRKKITAKIFFFLWLSDTLTDNQLEKIQKAILSKSLFSYEKAIIVSGITISLLRCFDTRKFIALFDIYDAGNRIIWERALVGLVFSFYTYDNRIELYPELTERLEKISLDDDIEENIEIIILQLIRTKETKEITKRMMTEIAPELDKFKSFITEKLDLDKIIPDNIGEDDNPEWEELLEDSSGVFGKMAEFSQMQLDGSDVFMSAFANLKHFDFFKQTHNWFLPFYKDNIEIVELFNEETENFDVETFLETLAKSTLMCNSDKYSFCLNIDAIPEQQKKMMLGLFKMEIEAMNEDAYEDKILNKNISKKIFTNYIQEYYRFLKLHPWRDDFFDIFESKMDIQNTVFYKTIVKNENVLKKIGDLYFKKKFFVDAINTYKLLETSQDKAVIYEKTAFAYQKIKNYEQALKYYLRAELLDRESVWIYKKTAFCYGKTGDYENALKYYQKANKIKPENMHILANIGQCHIYLENHEQALKQYYKIEYFDPDNIKAMRPIAWCSLFLAKFDSAKKYLEKLIKLEPSYFDYISLGNVFLCENNKKEAINAYTQALKMSDKNKFIQALEEDKDILFKHGVSSTDYMLLKDYISTII